MDTEPIDVSAEELEGLLNAAGSCESVPLDVPPGMDENIADFDASGGFATPGVPETPLYGDAGFDSGGDVPMAPTAEPPWASECPPNDERGG